jgi:nucleotide-binding universal stress UspA family protein
MDRNVSDKFLILVGIDFSENGQAVLQSAVDLAFTTPEAELHLVHAFGPAVPADDLRWFSALSDLGPIEDSDAAATALHQLATSIPLRAERVCAYVHEGSATAVITQVAEDIEADVVVVGTHDHQRVNRAFFGSVAEKLVRTAPCPVLLIRRKSVLPSADSSAPLCPACEAGKRLTWGAHPRCLHHAQSHSHVDNWGNGSFHTEMAPS